MLVLEPSPAPALCGACGAHCGGCSTSGGVDAPTAIAAPEHGPTCVCDLPDSVLEQVLRAALGPGLEGLWAAASVCRRWRRLARAAALTASLRCKGPGGAAAGLQILRQISGAAEIADPGRAGAPPAAPPPAGGTPQQPPPPPLLLPHLKRLEVVVEGVSPAAAGRLLEALAGVEAAYARCPGFELELRLNLETGGAAPVAAAAAGAGPQRALAPLRALRAVAALALAPESGALTPALAAALAPRLASLALGAVRAPGAVAALPALGNLRELTLEFDAPGAGGAWAAPLAALAGRLRALDLSWVTFHARGGELQGALLVVSQLSRLERLSLSRLDLLHLSPDGRPARADLAPLAAMTRLTVLRLHGGSASVQREKVLREILRPLASLPRLEAATLSLFARRWRFERDVALPAGVFRRWATDEEFSVKFPLEAS